MKKENQKLKAYYVREILLRETDENHSLNTQKIIDLLEKYGISAERKSIYSDISALVDAGLLDVEQTEGRGGGFRVLSREFELAELKMLVDAVQSCRFISKKQCTSLIKKLSHLVSTLAVKPLKILGRRQHVYLPRR